MNHTHPSNILAHCPLCQVAYQEKEVRLVGEKGATKLFHCTCRACGHAMLALILESQGSLSTVGVVTDLEVQDALRFRDSQAITDDDCIRAHQIVEQESRELCRLLMKTA